MGKKKIQRKVEHMRNMPFQTMPAGWSGYPALYDSIINRARNPRHISEVTAEMFGGDAGEVTDIAIAVINEGPNLQLSFEQWNIVQGLIEDGITRGYERGSQDATDRG